MLRFDALSADEQISQLPIQLETKWSSLVVLNWIKIYSPCRKLKGETRVRFTINKVLFHCFDNLDVYKLFGT